MKDSARLFFYIQALWQINNTFLSSANVVANMYISPPSFSPVFFLIS